MKLKLINSSVSAAEEEIDEDVGLACDVARNFDEAIDVENSEDIDEERYPSSDQVREPIILKIP